MGISKNLGSISSIHIGQTPPDNYTLIWYDNTPALMCHKIYDFDLEQWVLLNQEIISAITYSELVSIAVGVGLTIGKFYYISDIGGYLAITLTPTKVQYIDLAGNLILDDLGTQKQYYVSSGNLSIEDLTATFNETTKKLNFIHEEPASIESSDFMFGKVYRSAAWKLAKIKLSSLISSVSGNSISWNGGLFFNFLSALNSRINVPGGVVGRDSYNSDMSAIQTSITNLGNGQSSSSILGKTISAPSVVSPLSNAVAGDTLQVVINKFQSWINSFKKATGITVSSDFKASTPTDIVADETIDSALRKSQGWFSFLKGKVENIESGSAYEQYDHVVNSNESLRLMNGLTAKRVLIKKGTWTFEFAGEQQAIIVTGIKEIFAEPGAVIRFTGTPFGGTYNYCLIGGNALFDTSYRNIEIEVATNSNVIGFANMCNLTNCRIKNLVTDPAFLKWGFRGCNNLINCRVQDSIVGFSNCKNLVNCSRNNSYEGLLKVETYIGFDNCSELVNCEDYFANEESVVAITEFSSFKDCSNLVNCNSIAYVLDYISNVYNNCERISNCKSSLILPDSQTWSLTHNLFYSCKKVISCKAFGPQVANPAVCFKDCLKVQQCEAVGGDSSYNTSYASSVVNETYMCQDTPEGGFNS